MDQSTSWFHRPDKRKSHPITSIRSDKRYLKSKRSLSVDKSINSIVSPVSRNNIERWINDLASFHMRYTKSSLLTKQPIG